MPRSPLFYCTEASGFFDARCADDQSRVRLALGRLQACQGAWASAPDACMGECHANVRMYQEASTCRRDDAVHAVCLVVVLAHALIAAARSRLDRNCSWRPIRRRQSNPRC